MRKRDVETALDRDWLDASPSIIYPGYYLWRGSIHPDKGDGERYVPLSDWDLFLRFAGLWSHGQPSEESILDWTRSHGLLFGSDTPVKVSSFRAESKAAHGALALYRALQKSDAGRVRDLVRFTEGSQDAELQEEDVRLHFAPRAGTDELDSEHLLRVGISALQSAIDSRLRRATVRFRGFDFSHPNPLKQNGYRPRLTMFCPDLASCLWYQFARVVEDRRAVSRCPECEDLYTPAKSNQITCGKDRCRQSRSRANRAGK